MRTGRTPAAPRDPAAEARPPLPGVTVIATVRDEEPYLATAVRSILEQDYDGDLSMVLTVGPSRDRTREIADELAAQDSRLTILDNPTGSRSEGLNTGIVNAEAEHEVVVRIDGHTVFEPTYVRRAVSIMLAAGADGAGGIMSPEGGTPTQSAVARAMSHPAGLGSASFHVGGEPGPAETVYLGAFRREAIEKAGGFDHGIIRGEDWELCLRMRRNGSLLWFDPSLRVTYRPRRRLAELAKQFWRTGMWRREIIRRHPETASQRYLAPPVVLLALMVAAVTVVAGLMAGVPAVSVAGLIVLAGYLLGEVVAAAHAATRPPRLDWRAALLLPVVLVVMHLCWGAGFLRGVSDHAARDHRT